mmetsp:Transcript_39712/g.100701  ORF Transcript_39712/g.100701 Transcript_39712/m.100701 type:complete len:604 (-) Transcript_39712:287-2098(-)
MQVHAVLQGRKGRVGGVGHLPVGVADGQRGDVGVPVDLHHAKVGRRVEAAAAVGPQAVLVHAVAAAVLRVVGGERGEVAHPARHHLVHGPAELLRLQAVRVRLPATRLQHFHVGKVVVACQDDDAAGGGAAQSVQQAELRRAVAVPVVAGALLPRAVRQRVLAVGGVGLGQHHGAGGHQLERRAAGLDGRAQPLPLRVAQHLAQLGGFQDVACRSGVRLPELPFPDHEVAPPVLAVRGVARLAPLGVTLLGGPVLLAPAVEELVVALAAGALAQGAAEQEVLAPGDGLVGAGAVKGGVVPQHAVAVPRVGAAWQRGAVKALVQQKHVDLPPLRARVECHLVLQTLHHRAPRGPGGLPQRVQEQVLEGVLLRHSAVAVVPARVVVVVGAEDGVAALAGVSPGGHDRAAGGVVRAHVLQEALVGGRVHEAHHLVARVVQVAHKALRGRAAQEGAVAGAVGVVWVGGAVDGGAVHVHDVTQPYPGIGLRWNDARLKDGDLARVVGSAAAKRDATDAMEVLRIGRRRVRVRKFDRRVALAAQVGAAYGGHQQGQDKHRGHHAAAHADPAPTRPPPGPALPVRCIAVPLEAVQTDLCAAGLATTIHRQ